MECDGWMWKLSIEGIYVAMKTITGMLVQYTYDAKAQEEEARELKSM